MEKNLIEMRINSVELCKIINELRKEEKGDCAKKLTHDNLMKKIRKEIEIMESLGLSNEQNFNESSYINSQNKEQPCYSLNASAMRQMLNSESVYVRYKTEEYIKKLENENEKLKSQVPQITEEDLLLIKIAKTSNKAEQMIAVGEYGNYKLEQGKEEIREKEVKPLQEENETLKPKAKYTDEVLNNKSLLTITQIAKDFGLSGQTLNRILVEQKVQYKQSGQWLLYAKYQDKGYTQSSTYSNQGKSYITTKWTEKGRKFIIDLLLSLGYKIK